jgi:signal transduction histidine kinase
MGIGAYESFQYVQELGGKISVDSAVDRGTIVTVLLPLFESSGTRICNLSELHEH